jgi:hypothetical protein
MSPRRLFQSDVELQTKFAIELAADHESAQLHCKGVDEEGNVCAAAWEVEIESDGTLDVGVRNALLQHARYHNGGFSKMRRLS